GPAPLQDQADRADRRWIGNTARQQFPVDRSVATFTEVTGVPQWLANGQDEILDGAFGAIDGRRQAAGPALPVNAIQALLPGPRDPTLHRGQGDAKVRSDLVQGKAAPDSCDHRAPLLRRVGFLLMAVSSNKVSGHVS